MADQQQDQGRDVVVTFAGWEGGEWGTMGREQAGRAEQQMFRSLNMLRYKNGLLGPRPGLRKQPVTGLPVGLTHGFGWMGVPGKSTWIVVDDELYTFEPLDLSAATLRGTLGMVPPTEPIYSIEGDSGRSILSSVDDSVYELDLNAGVDTLTPLPGVPAGRALGLSDARLFVGGLGPDHNRVYFSDPFDLYTFDALSYFDVGFVPQVRFMANQRGHLLIAKQDYSFWVLTGTPGTPSAQLRRLRSGGGSPWHLWPAKVTTTADDVLWYIADTHDEPAMFDGSTVERFRHLEGELAASVNPNSTLSITAAVLGREDEVIFYSQENPGRALVRRNGVWTRHQFETAIAPGPFVTTDRQGLVHFATGGGVGEVPDVYTWAGELDRPGFADDALARPGDASAGHLQCTLELPEWAAPPGHECKLRGVIVDFVEYPTGAGESNHFDIAVYMHRVYGGDAPGGEGALWESDDQSWDNAQGDPDVEAAGAAGLHRSKHFGFGTIKGRAFGIDLWNIRGVAFRSVTAVVQVWEKRVGA